MRRFESVYKNRIFSLMNKFELLTVDQLLWMLNVQNEREDMAARQNLSQLIHAGILGISEDGKVIKLTQIHKVSAAVLDCIWVMIDHETENGISQEDFENETVSFAGRFAKPLRLVYTNANTHTVYYVATVRCKEKASEILVFNEYMRRILAFNSDGNAPKVKVIILTWDVETAKHIPATPDYDAVILVLTRGFGRETDISAPPYIQVYQKRCAGDGK